MLRFFTANLFGSAFGTKILITPSKAMLAHYKLEEQSLFYCLCTSLICSDISEPPPSVWSDFALSLKTHLRPAFMDIVSSSAMKEKHA